MRKLPGLYFFLTLIFLLIISLVYSWPFFKPGLIVTDDGIWSVVRLAEMVRELKDFQIPPRWAGYLNHGYGYPLFSFAYPLPYYLGAFLKFTGLSYVSAVKFLFIGSTFLSVFFMYLLGSTLTGPGGGLTAALFYLIAPYRLTDLYVRGSLGESISFLFFPLIFYLTVKIFKESPGFKPIFLSLSLSALMLCHNVMAVLFIPVWLFFVFFLNFSRFGRKENDKKTSPVIKFLPVQFLKILFLSLSLAAFFILPALMEKKFLVLDKIQLAAKSLNFISLINLVTRPQNTVYPFFNLGIPQLTVAGLSVLALFRMKKDLDHRSFMISVLIILAALIFLTNNISSFFWQLPILNSIDFPWRVMGLVIFMLALLTSFIGSNRNLLAFGLLLAGIGFFRNLSLINPAGYTKQNDEYYLTNDATTTSTDEFMPIWVTDPPGKRFSEKVSLPENALISDLVYNSKTVKFNLLSRQPGRLIINTIYFPGWQATLNGKNTAIIYNNPQGLISLDYPSGASRIEAFFKETPLRKTADVISLLALIYIIFSIMKRVFKYVR